MTKPTAAQRLASLQNEIAASDDALESLRDQHAELVAAGDDPGADQVSRQIREAVADLETLRDRVPVLERLAEDEADAEREAQAAELTAQADAIRAELVGHYDAAAKAASALREARAAIDEGAPFKWYQLARKARALGGSPDLSEIPGMGELRGTLAVTARELSNIAEAVFQRGDQIRRS